MNFSNSYITLGKPFYQNVLPEKVCAPAVLLWNQSLAEQLKVEERLCKDPKQQAQFFSGNQMFEESEPIALAYSGHQFGHLNPQLGDGRAHLLGEVIDCEGNLKDIQLKGSGRTLWSRQGDGRCAIGPALREYIMSEALFFLGVPTTRCLAVIASGENVFRETEKPGAIVTRIASSHIRVGTFQYFAIKSDMESLLLLTDYTITRHFNFINAADNQTLENRVLSLLKAVMEKQSEMVINWLRIGFIHGVMNTDNTPIFGETLDFGPCAMINQYRAGTVFSSIDINGRYAFNQQLNITVWNMSRFAECLMMLLIQFGDKSQVDVIAQIEPLLVDFQKELHEKSDLMYANKLGFDKVDEFSKASTEALLSLMEQSELDYTNTFSRLTRSISPHLSKELPPSLLKEENLGDFLESFELPASLRTWYIDWHKNLDSSRGNQNVSEQSIISNKMKEYTLMIKSNPVMIPRNHQVEQLLSLCELGQEQGNIAIALKAVNDYLEALKTPYEDNQNTEKYLYNPEQSDDYYQTFCGT
jgi:uncharacterized protein YdiU (UPF0061 family)